MVVVVVRTCVLRTSVCPFERTHAMVVRGGGGVCAVVVVVCVVVGRREERGGGRKRVVVVVVVRTVCITRVPVHTRKRHATN